LAYCLRAILVGQTWVHSSQCLFHPKTKPYWKKLEMHSH